MPPAGVAYIRAPAALAVSGQVDALFDLPPPTSKEIFIKMTGFNAPLRRSRSNRMIAGVVAGLARYLGMDVTLARVLYVLISIFSAAFPGILIYVIFWVLTPEEDEGNDRLIESHRVTSDDVR